MSGKLMLDRAGEKWYNGCELPTRDRTNFFLAIVSQLKNICCTQSPLVNVKLVLAELVAQHSRIRWPEDFVFSGPTTTKGQTMSDLSKLLDEARHNEEKYRDLLLLWKTRRRELEAQIPTAENQLQEEITQLLQRILRDDNNSD